MRNQEKEQIISSAVITKELSAGQQSAVAGTAQAGLLHSQSC